MSVMRLGSGPIDCSLKSENNFPLSQHIGIQFLIYAPFFEQTDRNRKGPLLENGRKNDN